MNFLKLGSMDKKIILGSIFCFLILALLDTVLAVGVALIVFLTAITFLIFKKAGFKTKTIYILFLITLSIYFGAVLFFYYTNFQPFSGGAGDYSTYDSLGQEISGRLHQGNFSLQGIAYENFYPVIIGYIYTLTLPEVLIGRMFNAFVAALLAAFIYLIVLEMGGSEKQGFFSGLMANIYPSLIFFGTLLGKDVLAPLLALIVLFLILKLLKTFSFAKFIIFYIFLGALIQLRIYIGFAALLTFIICWPIFSNLKLKKRLLYAFIAIILLGFLPQISAGQGYYGINFIKAYLTQDMIIFFRERISIPNPKISETTGLPVYDESPTPESSLSESPNPIVTKRGRGSAIEVKAGFENPFKFLRNSVIAFIYASLGPFPWQLRYLRHLLILPETILWYFALFFAIKGIKKPVRSHAFTLCAFSLLVLGSLSVFLTNYGITTRIRVPAFLAIFCLTPFGINWISDNKIIKFFSKSLDALIKT